jgi:hypothetical protein
MSFASVSPQSAPVNSLPTVASIPIFVRRSTGGDFHPVLLRLKNGSSLPFRGANEPAVDGKLGKLEIELPKTSAFPSYPGDAWGDAKKQTITFITPRDPEFPEFMPGELIFANAEGTQPAPVVITRTLRDRINEIPSVGDQIDQMENSWKPTTLGEGVAKGLLFSGVDLLTGGLRMTEWTARKGLDYATLIVTSDEDGLRTRFKADIAAVTSAGIQAGNIATFVGSIIVQGNVDRAQLAIDLLTLDFDGLAELGGRYEENISTMGDLLELAVEEVKDLDPGEQGVILGALIFEIAAAFIPGGQLKQVTKLKAAEALAAGRVAKSGPGARVFARMVQHLDGLAKTKMCFIAGTLVLTSQGSLAIEQVAPGHLVWARDAFTKAEGWRPVVQTFTTYPEELFTLGYDTDGDGAADEELTGTGEHPFWVEDFGEFLPMRDLRPGMRLSLAQEGSTAIVTGNVSKRGPPGERFTTYNFEVAEYHTYFVGSAGVWVHNFSERFCQRFFSITHTVQLQKNIPGDGRGQRFEILTGAFDEAWRRGEPIDAEHGNLFMHVTQLEEFRDYNGSLAGIASVKEQRALRNRLTAGGFMGSGGFDIHHAAEKWMQRALGVLESKLDDVPGIPIRRGPDAMFDADYFQKFGKNPVYHGSTGGPGSLANMLGVIERNLRSGQITTQQMVNQVNDLYTTPPFSDLNLWPVTRDWLRQSGTRSDIIIPD